MLTKIIASASAISGLVVAVLVLLVAFGVNITPDQHTAIEGLVAAIMIIVGTLLHPDIPVGVTK